MISRNSPPVVALDLMGGDHGPAVTVPAAKQALLLSEGFKISATGVPEACLPLLSQHGLDHHDRFSFIPSTSSLPSGCTAAEALRRGRGSSMRDALELVSSGCAGSCVSAGSTAALLALSCHTVRRLPGVSRPALAAFLPNASGNAGRSLVLDLGANVSCTPENLFQFALLGALEFRSVMRTPAPPRVALLNVGVEQTKGSECIKKANEMLQKVEFINFIGYIEGDCLFNSSADVIVCDGFAGNIALKASEGLVRLIRKKAEDGMTGMWRLLRLPLGLFVRRRMRDLLPDSYNGAALLGLQGAVIKSHGAAGVRAVAQSVIRAAEAVREVPPRDWLDLLKDNGHQDVQ